MLFVRFPDTIEKRLEYIAKKTGHTKTYLVRAAILEYLEDLEDYYTAIKRLKNPGRRWTMDEVKSKLGLGD